MGFILRGPFSNVGEGTPQYMAVIFEKKTNMSVSKSDLSKFSGHVFGE
jgi:hypothetical protein